MVGFVQTNNLTVYMPSHLRHAGLVGNSLQGLQSPQSLDEPLSLVEFFRSVDR